MADRRDLTPGQIAFLSDQYDACIRAADGQLAGFFTFLTQRGLWQRILVAVPWSVPVVPTVRL